MVRAAPREATRGRRRDAAPPADQSVPGGAAAICPRAPLSVSLHHAERAEGDRRVVVTHAAGGLRSAADAERRLTPHREVLLRRRNARAGSDRDAALAQRHLDTAERGDDLQLAQRAEM